MSDQVLSKLETTSSRLLAMAVALLGESRKGRAHMQFSEADMLAILAGERELTWTELDLLTTLLIKEQGALIAQNRDLRELIQLRATRK